MSTGVPVRDYDWAVLIAKMRRRGVSQTYLSELTGVPYSTLQQLTSGFVKSPRYSTAMKILLCAGEHLSSEELRYSERRLPL